MNFAAEFQRTKNKANAIKSDPEKQPKSKIFGVSSILSAAIGVAFSFVIVFGIKWLMSDNLWRIIGGAVIGLIGLAGTLAGIYKAIESWAFQKYINKSPITWISLAVWILAIAGIAVVIIMLV